MMMRCQVIDRPESILMTTSFADICRFFGHDDIGIGIAFAIRLRFVLLLSVSYQQLRSRISSSRSSSIELVRPQSPSIPWSTRSQLNYPSKAERIPLLPAPSPLPRRQLSVPVPYLSQHVNIIYIKFLCQIMIAPALPIAKYICMLLLLLLLFPSLDSQINNNRR